MFPQTSSRNGFAQFIEPFIQRGDAIAFLKDGEMVTERAQDSLVSSW